FLRLPFDIHSHSEPHLTSVRRRSIRDLSRSQRTRDRSGDALSFLLQRQTDRALALARVDDNGPRSSQSIPSLAKTHGTTSRGRSNINWPPVNKYVRDATVSIKQIATRDRQVCDLPNFDRSELVLNTEDLSRPNRKRA